MSTLAQAKTPLAKNVSFRAGRMYVLLSDGREIGVPVAWFPRLDHAAPSQLANWRFTGGGLGIHFPDLDEDISIAGLLG